MTRHVAAVAASIATIATACVTMSKNYDVEIHVVRVWGVDDDLPERLR